MLLNWLLIKVAGIPNVKSKNNRKLTHIDRHSYKISVPFCTYIIYAFTILHVVRFTYLWTEVQTVAINCHYDLVWFFEQIVFFRRRALIGSGVTESFRAQSVKLWLGRLKFILFWVGLTFHFFKYRCVSLHILVWIYCYRSFIQRIVFFPSLNITEFTSCF